MRNAVAHLDEDLAFDEPVRKAKAARPRAAAARKRPAARSRRGKLRYAHYAAIGLSAAVAVGIMVNALALQHSRHPAPLFGEAIQLGDRPAPAAATRLAASPSAASTPLAASTPSAAAPVADKTASGKPTPEPAEQTASLPPAAGVPTPVQRPHRAPEAAAAAKARSDDPIAKLLKTSGVKPSDKADPDGVKDGTKTVLATQHALMKLGFVVKPNGTFGPVTRAALETFERDQHLPVKGEMTRKVLKHLSLASGVAID